MFEEIEALNPHFKWDRRKQKRRVMSQAKKLANGTYAIGCRGHPGIIQNKIIRPADIHGSDLEVVSLLDGCEGSCSIYHCCPTPISKDWALWLAMPFNYEVDKLVRSLSWFVWYDDFDEYWTIEQHRDDMIKHRNLVDLLLTSDPSDEELKRIEILQNAYDKAIAGEDPGPVETGYIGETYRSKRGVRACDFATPEEISFLLKFGEENYKNKILYKELGK